MEMNFTKMNASGNDFIVIDNTGKILPEDISAAAKKLCRRKYSIGADGLLVVEKSKTADFRMRIFNPDGSEAEMCGNGSRCIAMYAFINDIAGRKMVIQTLSGPVGAEIRGERVRVKLKDPDSLKFRLNIKIGNRDLKVSFINTGVPHAVVFVENTKDIDVKKLGRAIRYNSSFSPAGANVDFVSVIDKNSISIRTYERGVEDETLACGTGSVAAAIISGILQKILSPVHVHTRGGEILKVYYNVKKGTKTQQVVNSVFLEGRAEVVYEGTISDDSTVAQGLSRELAKSSVVFRKSLDI